MSELCVIPVELALDPRLSKNQIRVLIALFSFKNSNTETVWPSRKALSERCGLPETRISQTTSQLEELGWLVKDGKGGYSRTTRYWVKVPRLIPKLTTVTEHVTVTEPVNRSGYKTCNTQERIYFNSTPPARACVAKDKPKEPASTPPSEKSWAKSFTQSPQSPQAWAQYFTQRLHHRPGKPMLEKESALFVRWIEDGVRIEEVEEAIGIVEGRQTLVPSSPLYYREIVEEIRRAKAWEEKNPAPKGAAPDTNKRYKKQAPDYDSFQQPSQHAFKEYTPEKVTPSSPETAKSYLTQLNRLTNRCLTSAPRAAHLSARNLIGKSRC